jgi:hypothetical protein
LFHFLLGEEGAAGAVEQLADIFGIEFVLLCFYDFYDFFIAGIITGVILCLMMTRNWR